MRLIIALLMLISGVTYAAEPPTEEHPAEKLTQAEYLETLLAEIMPEAESRDVKRCVQYRKIRSIDPLSDRYVIFRERSGRVWLNRLEKRCIGLRGDQIIVYDIHGPSLCRLHRIRGKGSTGVGLSALCTLGDFEQMSVQQVTDLALRLSAWEDRELNAN